MAFIGPAKPGGLSISFKTADGRSLQKVMHDLGKNVTNAGNSYKEIISLIMAEGGGNIRSEAIKSMAQTKKSGTLQRRGGGKGGNLRFVNPSLPGEPPAIDEGNLVASITETTSWKGLEVGSFIAKTPYGKWLETGTKHMWARPWLEPAYTKELPAITVALGKALNETIIASMRLTGLKESL